MTPHEFAWLLVGCGGGVFAGTIGAFASIFSPRGETDTRWVKLTGLEKHLIRSLIREAAKHYGPIFSNSPEIEVILEKLA